MSQFIEMFGNPVTNTKGWKTAKIKDVAPEMPSKEQLSGKIWLLNLDMIESNTGRIIEKVYEDVENALSVQSFDEGNVLFSKLRPYLNKVVIPDEPGMATTELVPLRPEPSKLHKVFLSHLLRGNQFVNYANDIAGGTKMPRMPLTELRNFDCILPPMDKQLEFVFIAEQVDKSKFGDFKSQFIEMFGNPLSLNQKNELKRLGECCILNPRRPNIALCDTDKVSFIPMPAVSEDGYLVDMTDEEYGKVKKGFTYFENNDVLFAKITPCMENGKGAIAYGLTNGIGVGSTEFHVLRPINGISSPYWLLTLTRMPIFRERAAKNMSGTGGQKRVSASYLNHFMVGLPAIEEQRRFEAIYKQADKSKFGDFKSQFIEMFGTVENNTHNFPIMTIGEFAYCFAGATPSTSHPEYWENGRIRWMSSGEVHKGHVEDTDSRITELGYKSASTRMVPIHSIVIAIAGQGKTRGTVAITEVDLCTNQSLCAIVPDERVNYSYLYHNLQGRYLELRGLSGDVNGRGGLNLKIIQKIPVILPPIEKQQQFASIAQQADKSKSVIQKALVYLNDIQSDELRKIA